MLGDGDKKEEMNLIQEEKLSESLQKTLNSLNEEVKLLRIEFKHLLKTGKKLRKIIKSKEAKNSEELSRMQHMQQDLSQKSVNQIRNNAEKLKNEEQEESRLSKEEATILQGMLNELHDTYTHGERIVAADKELYLLIKKLYATDLDDYQLEIADSAKK